MRARTRANGEESDWIVVPREREIERGWARALRAFGKARAPAEARARVDTILMEKNVASTRGGAKQIVRDARVMYDGEVVTRSDMRVDARRLVLDGKELT